MSDQMIYRRVKLLIECDARAVMDPAGIADRIELALKHTCEFRDLQATLVEAEPLTDPYSPRGRRRSRKKHWFVRWLIRWAMNRMGVPPLP